MLLWLLQCCTAALLNIFVQPYRIASDAVKNPAPANINWVVVDPLAYPYQGHETLN